MIEKQLSDKAAAHQAVELRKAAKARKPKFKRHESWRYKRLKESWRKPRGLDNRVRRKSKGWPRSVNVGYGGPKKARGLHPSGYEEVLVHTPDDVGKVNAETQAIRIAHTVGMRKRIQIASRAREKEIHIFNPLVKTEIEEEEAKVEEGEEEEEENTHVPAISESEEATARTKAKRKSFKRSEDTKEVRSK